MRKYYLGIDLGTSSVKVLAVSPDGVIQKERWAYREMTVSGWEAAAREAVAALAGRIGKKNILGVGLSSQVGTYITDTGALIHWWESAGEDELAELKDRFTQDRFLAEISMCHPDIVSYPLPRLLYIHKHHPDARRVYMPKEHLLQALTGGFVSDPFSYRGLFCFEKGKPCHDLLEELDLRYDLPPMLVPTEVAGYVTPVAAQAFGLLPGTPVYVGMNDFFAGLIGMGVTTQEDAFDISGTSEHIGSITAQRMTTNLVSGPYITGFATYGGTKSSGLSCGFALKSFPTCPSSLKQIKAIEPPIFLPYLRGERAPIFDEDARGVFFGIGDRTDTQALHYSVLEGVAFSLYDIGCAAGLEKGGRLICGGGSSVNVLLTKLKSTLFDKEVVNVLEQDTSALGAAMAAMVGGGVFADYAQAARALVRYEDPVTGDEEHRPWLLRRFELYRQVYDSLRPQFRQWRSIREET